MHYLAKNMMLWHTYAAKFHKAKRCDNELKIKKKKKITNLFSSKDSHEKGLPINYMASISKLDPSSLMKYASFY